MKFSAIFVTTIALTGASLVSSSVVIRSPQDAAPINTSESGAKSSNDKTASSINAKKHEIMADNTMESLSRMISGPGPSSGGAIAGLLGEFKDIIATEFKRVFDDTIRAKAETVVIQIIKEFFPNLSGSSSSKVSKDDNKTSDTDASKPKDSKIGDAKADNNASSG